MGSTKKHRDKDKERDRRREKDKKHDRERDKERHRKRSRSRDRDDRHRKDRKEYRDNEGERRKPRVDEDDDLLEYAMQESNNEGLPEPQIDSGGGGGNLSLSIGDTNKLRLKLGLKPLQVDGAAGNSEEQEKKTSLLDDVHLPPENISDKEQQEKMRRKLEEIREKRRIYKKLSKVTPLGDEDSGDDGAVAWVKKSRKKEKEKEMAKKTEQMLAEMDEEFGIGDLINQEFGSALKPKAYTSRDLRGLTVEHDQTNFKEGMTTILTLKDQGILDDEGDTLYNINIEDTEKANKNIDLRKKKPTYQPYDEVNEDEMFKMKGVLEKYDGEIDGEKKTSFALEAGGKFDASREDDLEKIKAKLRKEMISLEMAKPKLASEYYTEEEMVKFKKPKKRRKVRKREPLKVDELESIAGSTAGSSDHGSRNMRSKLIQTYGEEAMEIAPIEPNDEGYIQENVYSQEENDNDLVLEDDQAQLELELALQRSRRSKKKKHFVGVSKAIQEIAAAPKQIQSDENEGGLSIVIDSTSEFCRTLGEIPTYGASGNRAEEEEEEEPDEEAEWQMDIDREQKEPQGGWEWVKAQEEKKRQDADKLEEESRVLDDEPIVGVGMAAALLLASKKGLLNAPGKHRHEEKFVAELPFVGVIDQEKMSSRPDDKDRSRFGRDRDSERDKDRYRVEKDNYKPNVKLDYVDEHGRQMTPKEAFRYLSHRFHGKMPAKMKTEKRTKKIQEDMAMQKMSSVDTPLNTAALLKEKQKESQSPYLILSGGVNAFSTGTAIVKKK